MEIGQAAEIVQVSTTPSILYCLRAISRELFAPADHHALVAIIRDVDLDTVLVISPQRLQHARPFGERHI